MSRALPKWSAGLPWDAISRVSKSLGLDPVLIAAVIQTESSGNTWAVRFERAYRWLWDLDRKGVDDIARVIGITVATMEAMQKTSWGLMQIMYAVALEHGYRGWPAQLCDPDEGVLYGSVHLRAMARLYGPDPARIYAAYNAGSPRKGPDGTYDNQEHVDHFLRNYRDLGGAA